MQRGSSALLCLALCTAIVMTPSLINIADHDLYNSAWAKGSGKGGGNGNGGNSGGSNNSGGKGSAAAGGKTIGGKSPFSRVTRKAKNEPSSAVKPANASVAAATASVVMAQKALAEAIHAFETALAEPGTNTNTLLRLERAITVAENSLQKASAKAAAFDQGLD